MKIAAPKNLFTHLLFSCLPENNETEILYKESSLAASELSSGNVEAAVIPSIDLVNNKDFIISGKFALSFYRTLGNAYYYFLPDLQEIHDINLAGDISSLEAILTKIIFREKYASDVKIELLNGLNNNAKKNILIAGDDNFKDDKFMSALSLTEEITDILGMPFVNYLFCAKDEETIKLLNTILETIKADDEELINQALNSYPFTGDVREFIKEELGGVSFQFTSELQIALHELIRLPYYHGLLDDMFDLKFG